VLCVRVDPSGSVTLNPSRPASVDGSIPVAACQRSPKPVTAGVRCSRSSVGGEVVRCTPRSTMATPPGTGSRSNGGGSVVPSASASEGSSRQTDGAGNARVIAAW